MSLNEDQKKTVSQWIEDGLELSEIQSRLSSDLGISMTYMETRFLVDDLGLQLKDEEEEAPEEAPVEEPAPESESSDDPEASPAGSGKVSVELDQIAHPGALVSGKVTFSDQKGASWTLDQFGRLGLQADEEGYKPSEEDLMEFQMELQVLLRKQGF